MEIISSGELANLTDREADVTIRVVYDRRGAPTCTRMARSGCSPRGKHARPSARQGIGIVALPCFMADADRSLARVPGVKEARTGPDLL